MIKLALVGVGHIHLPNFVKMINKHEQVHVKSVWDPDAERAAKRAQDAGAVVVQDPKDIWSDDEIQGVVICSETDLHPELVRGAAESKKHLFVEKPLGFTAADARKMATDIEDAGVTFQTGYFMRGNPVHLFLKEQIAKGTFGKITRIRHSNCHSGSLRGLFDEEWAWMADPKRAGCGAFGDLGTHSLDILLWLMGDVERVTANIDVATGRYGDCDEFGEGMLKFTNGAIGTLAAGWVDVADPVTILISGTEGHAHVNAGKLYITSKKLDTDGKEPWTDLPKAWPHAFSLYLDTLLGSKDLPLVTPKEAAMRNIVMEAFYEGAKKQTWIDIPRG